MSECTEIRKQIQLFVGGDLRDSERVALEDHISCCSSCERELQIESELIARVKDSLSGYELPTGLRDRIEAMVNREASAWSDLRKAGRQTRIYLAGLAVAASIVLVLGGVMFWHLKLAKIPATFIETPSDLAQLAVESHLQRVQGKLQLEVNSNSPQEISQWFSGKIPFNLALPHFEGIPEEEKIYRIAGGRRIRFRQDFAAYVSYQMNDKPISLVAISDKNSNDTRMSAFAVKDLTFYLDEISGLKTFTWSRKGLSYALVSDLDEYGQQSCMVCHPGSNIGDRVRVVKPEV